MSKKDLFNDAEFSQEGNEKAAVSLKDLREYVHDADFDDCIDAAFAVEGDGEGDEVVRRAFVLGKSAIQMLRQFDGSHVSDVMTVAVDLQKIFENVADDELSVENGYAALRDVHMKLLKETGASDGEGAVEELNAGMKVAFEDVVSRYPDRGFDALRGQFDRTLHEVVNLRHAVDRDKLVKDFVALIKNVSFLSVEEFEESLRDIEKEGNLKD